MAKKEQCIECKGYNTQTDLCTIKWCQPIFDGNDCNDYRNKQSSECSNASINIDKKTIEESDSYNSNLHIRKRGMSSVSNSVYVKSEEQENGVENEDESEERFDFEISKSAIRVIKVFLLTVFIISAIYGVYAYIKYQEEQKTEDLVWKARSELELIRSDKTIEYLRIHNISYEDKTLKLSLLRNIFETNGTMHFSDSIMYLEISSLMSLAPHRWDTICSILEKANVDLLFEYFNVKDKPVLVIPCSELHSKLLTSGVLEKGKNIFTILKGREVFQYAKIHFKNDVSFTVDSMSMNDNYVSLHLSYDDKNAKLGKSYLDTTHVNPHYTDPVGNMGSILDGMLAICSRVNKGVAFIYVGKNSKKRDQWAWDAEKTKKLINEKSKMLYLSGRKTNQVRTVIVKGKK